MDERTEALRDVFIDATGSETVTERQEESPGSLVDRDEAAIAERVAELVATMRERYGFSTDLDDATYERVVYAYFDAHRAAAGDATAERDDTTAERGDTTAADDFPTAKRDAAIAETLGIDPEVVRDARLDLHLVDEADRDAPFEYAALKRLLAEGRSADECATELGADGSVVERYAAVARADAASTRANDRFRHEFRELLTDADIEESHASGAREDGLREATEDIETDVSL